MPWPPMLSQSINVQEAEKVVVASQDSRKGSDEGYFLKDAVLNATSYYSAIQCIQ